MLLRSDCSGRKQIEEKMSDSDSVTSFDSMEVLVQMLRNNSFPKLVTKNDGQQDKGKMPKRSGLRRRRSVLDLHSIWIASGFSESSSASFNDEIQEDTLDMSPPILMKPAPKHSELVANAVIMATADTMKDCLHGKDDLHILQLFTSIAQKLESLASNSGRMAPADNCNVASDFTAFDDDSGVDNASCSQVPFRQPDDLGDDFLSCCEDFSVPGMEENIVDEFKTKALRLVTEALYHSHSDMPETPSLEILNLDNVASQFTEAFAADISELLHIAHFRHLAGENITDEELWEFAHSRYNLLLDKFATLEEELLSVDDQEGEQTDIAGSETKSWRLLQTPRPVMILETIPEVDEPSDDSSYSSEKIGLEALRSPKKEPSGSQSSKTLKPKKKHFRFKVKNPFKKKKKGQTGASDSVDQSQHCSTNTDTNSHSMDSETKRPRRLSIFSRIFSFFSCIN